MMSDRKLRIVVIGAGYAGLLAAVRLAGKTGRQPVEITLMNAYDTFVERVRLHQYAANQDMHPRYIAEMLRGTGILFVQGWVSALKPDQQEVVVQTASGEEHIAYDKLLYALGSTINRDSVPGVRDYAYTLTPRGSRSAEELRSVLPDMAKQGASLVVVGSGPTGIEAAAEFKDAYKGLRVRLVTRGGFGDFTSAKVANYMRQSLNRLGVTIQDQTTVTRVTEHQVITSHGDPINYDLCLWAGGFTTSPVAREAGLSVNERGQILVDPFLRSISHPEIYAIGDAAFPVQQPGSPVRMAASLAVMMGAHAADNLSAVVKHKAEKPFGFTWLGQGIALGRHNAIGFALSADDHQTGVIFTHWTGLQIRETFVKILAHLPLFEKRWPGFLYWPGKGRGKASNVTLPQRARSSV
jgi:NADH:quinone reductase (non-electrogenic)